MSSDYASLSAPVSEATTGPVSELQIQSPPQTARTASHRHRPAPQTNISFQSPARCPARVSSALVPVVSKLLWLCVCVLLVEASWSCADAAPVENGGHLITRHGGSRFRSSSRPSRSVKIFNKQMPNYKLVFPGIPLPNISVSYGYTYNSPNAISTSECAPVFSDRESRIASAYTILVARVLSKKAQDVRVKIERILKSQRRAVGPSKNVGLVRKLSLEFLLHNPRCLRQRQHALAVNRSYIFYLTPGVQNQAPAMVLWPPVATTLLRLESIFKHLCERQPYVTRASVTPDGVSSRLVDLQNLMQFRCENGSLKAYSAPAKPIIEQVGGKVRCTTTSSLRYTLMFLLRDGAVDPDANSTYRNGRNQIETTAPRDGQHVYVCQALNVRGLANSTQLTVGRGPTSASALVRAATRTTRPQRATSKSTASPIEPSNGSKYPCSTCIHGHCVLENDVETCECIRGYSGQFCEQLISRH